MDAVDYYLGTHVVLMVGILVAGYLGVTTVLLVLGAVALSLMLGALFLPS